MLSDLAEVRRILSRLDLRSSGIETDAANFTFTSFPLWAGGPTSSTDDSAGF